MNTQATVLFALRDAALVYNQSHIARNALRAQATRIIGGDYSNASEYVEPVRNPRSIARTYLSWAYQDNAIDPVAFVATLAAQRLNDYDAYRVEAEAAELYANGY